MHLIIATKILEEGLDVPSCNLIVRFDPSATVRSFIQSRGRARKQNSDYVLLVRRHVFQFWVYCCFLRKFLFFQLYEIWFLFFSIQSRQLDIIHWIIYSPIEYHLWDAEPGVGCVIFGVCSTFPVWIVCHGSLVLLNSSVHILVPDGLIYNLWWW